MRGKKLIVGAFVLALLVPAAAGATNGPSHHKRHHHHHQPAPVPTPEPVPVPAPVPTPTPPQVSVVSYCVLSTNAAGVDTYVYVQASPGSFEPGGDWRALYDANAKVLIAGNWFTFKNIGSAGIFLAPFVNGVSTC